MAVQKITSGDQFIESGLEIWTLVPFLHPLQPFFEGRRPPGKENKSTLGNTIFKGNRNTNMALQGDENTWIVWKRFLESVWYARKENVTIPSEKTCFWENTSGK